MSPRSLRSALVAAQLVGFLTLLRSVAFDRWFTVLVSALMIVGARAALRGRSWGVALAFAAAMWFPAAFLLGMAPAWFLLVGALGARPFARAWGAFRTFDRGAAAALAGLATGAAGLAAVFWKMAAPWLFWNVAALRPGIEPAHGLALAALATAGVAVAVRDRKRPGGLVEPALATAPATTNVRVATEERMRVEDDSALEEEAMSTSEDEEAAPKRAARLR